LQTVFCIAVLHCVALAFVAFSPEFETDWDFQVRYCAGSTLEFQGKGNLNTSLNTEVGTWYSSGGGTYTDTHSRRLVTSQVSRRIPLHNLITAGWYR
jgi:hypothetical protein